MWACVHLIVAIYNFSKLDFRRRIFFGAHVIVSPEQ